MEIVDRMVYEFPKRLPGLVQLLFRGSWPLAIHLALLVEPVDTMVTA